MGYLMTATRLTSLLRHAEQSMINSLYIDEDIFENLIPGKFRGLAIASSALTEAR